MYKIYTYRINFASKSIIVTIIDKFLRLLLEMFTSTICIPRLHRHFYLNKINRIGEYVYLKLAR